MKKNYIDPKGVERIVEVPDAHSDPSEGIPVSFRLDEWASNHGIPDHFVINLQKELFALELRLPEDILHPKNWEKLNAALRAAYQFDAYDLQAVAKGQLPNGTDKK